MSFTMIELCIAFFVIFATSSNASLCPEVCKCDDENLVVKCGLIGKAKKYKYKRIYRIRLSSKSYVIHYLWNQQKITDVHAHHNGNEAEPKPMFTLIPMTLNPHIRKLFVQNTSLERLDATLKFYPHLEELRLEGNQIKVSHSGRFDINR